jgi:argininosuccinate lyase
VSKTQLWGARFSKPMDKALFKMSQSTHFDWRLAPYDLLQSLAHTEGLYQHKVISKTQKDKLQQTLEGMLKDFLRGKLHPKPEDEDVHSALERILMERAPKVGGWIRSGRSRNDQISCDLRMYLRDQVRDISKLIVKFIEVLTAKGELHLSDPMPGFTHTQRAQPVTLGHYFLSHTHPLLRDLERIQEWDIRASVSPLGAGAVAGSGVVKDTQMTASLLGFDDYSLNSIDAVSDRDFVAEMLFILSLLGIHLAKISEEIILFTSKEFAFARLDDAWGTGSSMMPQKKNADGAELTRGKVGRLVGNLTALLTMLKGLPFAYNRDLQEDKEPIFDSIETLFITLPVVIGMVETLQFDTAKLASEADKGFALATEIADFLNLKGVDFKTSHEIAGQCVKLAEKRQVELIDLSLDDLKKIHPALTQELFAVLSTKGSIENRTSASGTSASSGKRQIKDIKRKTIRFNTWSNEVLYRKLHDA